MIALIFITDKTTSPCSSTRCYETRKPARRICQLSLPIDDVDVHEKNTLTGPNLPHAHSLFIFLIKAAHDEHEHRANTTLQDTQHKSLGVNALVVFAHRREDERETPYGHSERSDTLNREALGENHDGIRAEDEAKIENGSSPRVSVAREETQVFANTEKRL